MINERDFVCRVRRTVHRRPERSHAEVLTASYVERLLCRFGLMPLRPAPTSVAVVIGRGTSPPAVGFRADLDALALTEPASRPYASLNPGTTHACGHDGHTAALLGLARRLAADPPPVRVLLVWQQGEEAHPSGAPAVLHGLGDARPAEMFAFHLWPELPAGTVGSRPGPVLASVAGLVVTITGATGHSHGSACDSGAVDALRAGVEFHQEVTRRWTGRHPGSNQPAVVTIGQLDSGTAPNRTPVECTLRGTLRALSWADERDAMARLREIGAAVTARTGAQVQVSVQSGIRPPVINDPASVDRASTAAAAVGHPWLRHPAGPVGVSDDFGWYLEGCPGALLFLGCGGPGVPDLHQPEFDFDESVLLVAVDVADRIVRHLADQPPAAAGHRLAGLHKRGT